MNANPDTLYSSPTREVVAERDRNRLRILREKFSDKIARDPELADVADLGFAKFCVEMIRQEIGRALQSSPTLLFQPLGSYAYADSSHTMLTVTGIYLSEENRKQFIDVSRINRFEFAGLKWELTYINVPLLSHREKLALDQKFRGGKTAGRVASRIGFSVHKRSSESESMLKDYFTFHRYYPHFHRIQY